MSSSRRTHSIPLKASFTSKRSTSPIFHPAFSRQRSIAPFGAARKRSGSCANCACATIRARAVAPNSRARSADATITAAPPSLSFEAFPAVTVPPGLKDGCSFASASRLVSRGVSSLRTTLTTPFRPATSTGTISASNAPEPRAADLVHGGARHRAREPGRERGLAGGRLTHPGLHDVAHEDLVDLVGRHSRSLQRAPDRDGAEPRRGQRGEAPEERADRRPRGAEDDRAHFASARRLLTC